MAFDRTLAAATGVTPVSASGAMAADGTRTVIGLTLANILLSAITVDVYISPDAGTTKYYLGKNVPIPSGSAFVVIGGEHKVVLKKLTASAIDDQIYVVSDTAASVDSVVSYLE